jgi:uncharacterized protein YukE
MSLAVKAEARFMKHDELELLAQSHNPNLIEAEAEDLTATRVRIRDLLAKERGLVRSMRRSIRGKADERGGSFPGHVDKPARRKQVLAAALKRLNKELARRQAMEARNEMKDAARRALALKAEAGSDGRPAPGRTARKGMRSVANEKRQTIVHPAKVGSISQHTKNRQAARDARS